MNKRRRAELKGAVRKEAVTKALAFSTAPGTQKEKIRRVSMRQWYNRLPKGKLLCGKVL